MTTSKKGVGKVNQLLSFADSRGKRHMQILERHWFDVI
jgi:hypothetical protein